MMLATYQEVSVNFLLPHSTFCLFSYSKSSEFDNKVRFFISSTGAYHCLRQQPVHPVDGLISLDWAAEKDLQRPSRLQTELN
jgi:hypothetical protein